MNVEELNKHIDLLKENLGEGLLSCDTWITGTGQPIASYNGGNSKATALFDQISSSINKALSVAEFPEKDPYYLLHLENGTMLVVIEYEKYQWGIAIDPNKAPLGLTLNIAIPALLDSLSKN